MEVALEIQKLQDSVGCKIPQTVSAIDGIHMKQRYSISTQVVEGGNLKFLDIATGYPGGIHDAGILRDSELSIQAKRNILLTEPTGYRLVQNRTFFNWRRSISDL